MYPVGLRDFCHIMSLLPPGASVFHKHMSMFLKLIWEPNKRPKGSHNVHLSTMCNLFDGLTGRPFLYTYRPEKHKLGRGCWDLASCQVSWNSVQGFERKCWKWLSQSEARAAILFFFSIGPKNTNLVEDVKILLSDMNSVQRFQRKSRKCLSQSEARAAILFFRSARKTQTL